jgi:glycosyltransferase involved in cell wall biosynthesis
MPPRPLIIHTSNPEAGGAETSLLAAVAAFAVISPADGEPSGKPLFLVPAEGTLSRAVAARGWEFRVLPWPKGMAESTQGRWYAWPRILPGLLPYLWRLHRACLAVTEGEGGSGKAVPVWSSGAKSHAACALLAPWLGERLVFDIRDFLRPRRLRSGIAWVARRYGCRVRANSRAVAADFPAALIGYPQVTLQRPAIDRRDRRPGAKRIIVHLAYFAPYKGQDLFLQCARKLLDAGVNAEFWIIGEVIYPAPAYARYRERIHALAASLGLDTHVRFLGRVGSGEPVQALLEQAHLLLHCTREPEPFGRAVMEALLCGADAVCHGGSGVVEVTRASADLPEWAASLREVLGPAYVRVALDKVPGRDPGAVPPS